MRTRQVENLEHDIEEQMADPLDFALVQRAHVLSGLVVDRRFSQTEHGAKLAFHLPERVYVEQLFGRLGGAP
jgi:hypothetical protein